jgi:biotin-dependent carboxylase-like uncharacterized protein
VLEVIDPGTLATIQDGGRPDAAPLGVPRAGAADPLALAAANLLLGDDPGVAAIELTGGMVAMLARDDTIMAVTGADLGFRAGPDGPWVRPGTSTLLRAGTVVGATRAPTSGVRTYLALPGGVAVPTVLGSASTSAVGGFGGHEGRALRPGDLVRPADGDRRIGAGHAWPGPGPSSGVTDEAGPVVLAACDGPHRALLRAAATALLATTWVVGDQSDRAGIRLAPAPGDARAGGQPPSVAPTPRGPTLESFALAWGAIEVPPDGAPIVLLPDGPTVGGYPVPLVVARADLPRLGQLRPGDLVRFRSVTPATARSAWLAADAALARAGAALVVMRSVW